MTYSKVTLPTIVWVCVAEVLKAYIRSQKGYTIDYAYLSHTITAIEESIRNAQHGQHE